MNLAPIVTIEKINVLNFKLVFVLLLIRNVIL